MILFCCLFLLFFSHLHVMYTTCTLYTSFFFVFSLFFHLYYTVRTAPPMFTDNKQRDTEIILQFIWKSGKKGAEQPTNQPTDRRQPQHRPCGGGHLTHDPFLLFFSSFFFSFTCHVYHMYTVYFLFFCFFTFFPFILHCTYSPPYVYRQQTTRHGNNFAVYLEERKKRRGATNQPANRSKTTTTPAVRWWPFNT